MTEHANPRESVLSVDVQRLSRVYAEAALNAAGDADAQTALVEEFGNLERQVLDAHPRIEAILASALIPLDEKIALVERIFGGRASTTLLNALRVMARHGRLGFVRGVARSIRDLWETRSSRVRIRLETAHPIDAALEREIAQALQRMLGAEPTLIKRVNPELLAGFVVRVGDRVYDASARAGLERLGKQMVDRAVETIQSSPQRFMEGVAGAAG